MSLIAHSALVGLAPAALAMLLTVSLLAGIGIAAVGPGGVLLTIGLFAITALPPPVVAGTAIVTHLASGVVGSAAYLRSGQLRARPTRHLALVLSAATLVGAPLGVWLNTLVSRRGFGVLLASFALAIGLLLWRRGRHIRRSAPDAPAVRHLPSLVAATIGLAGATASGLFGLGGPMIAVPLLVAARVPILAALAAAQAQSLVIAALGSADYAWHGSIDWAMAAFVGVPQAFGVVAGWRIAHAVPTRALTYTLAAALITLAPYLALWSG